MQSSSERVDPNLKGLLLALAAFGLLLAYALPALNTRNPLWFLPSTGTAPSEIITYRQGVRTVHRPGSAGYETLAPLCEKMLTHVTGLDDSGLSDETMRDIRTGGYAIEIFYAKPITIPTLHYVGRPNQIFIPLDDKYAGWTLVYTGNDGRYWAQGLRIYDVYDEIKTAFYNMPAPKR